MDSTGESSGSSFVDWVVENGGDVELVDLLKANRFMSKLSLKNIDFGSPEASSFVDQLSTTQSSKLLPKDSPVLPIFISTVLTNHKR